MKFVTFKYDGKERFGGLKDECIVDLTDAFGSLRETLQNRRLEDAKTIVAASEPTLDLADVTLRPLVTDAEKYLCIGVNYANRNAEYKDGSEPPKWPSLFVRTRESFVGHNEFILRPPESHQLDYEGEITLIIGKEGRRISEDDALDHIAGLTLMNEGTLRDWVRHAKFNVTQGKNFEKSGSIGPWMVTMDEIDDVANLDLQTRVNGELRQDDNTSNMMFPIKFIVAYVSQFARLKPGDIIATGTPNGAGARFDPPKYLVPGDVVEVTCPAIGTLSNTVKDEIV